MFIDWQCVGTLAKVDRRLQLVHYKTSTKTKISTRGKITDSTVVITI